MTIQTPEPAALSRLRRVLPSSSLNRAPQVPLRGELFLISHDDQTGRCLLDHKTLTRGLACAVLLDLWLAGRLHIGTRYDVRDNAWSLDPGRIRVIPEEPTGDTLTDSAFASVWLSGAMRVEDFVREFAATGLYERVRADLVAAGVLRRTVRRRFLFRREAHLPTDDAYPVRARARVRTLIDKFRHTPEQVERRAVALAGLVSALGLTRRVLELDEHAGRLQRWLQHIVDQQRDPSVRDVMAFLSA